MKRWIYPFSAVVAILLLGLGLWAQSSGSITGTVTDKTGAVIPGATVQLTNLAQGATQTATTNHAGAFVFAGLQLGQYDLAVTAKGFQRYRASKVELRAGQAMRVNPTLVVGSVTSTVEVSGTAVGRVQLENATVSQTITGKQVTQLVLNGRNFSQLIKLVPGVVDSTNGSGTSSTEGAVGVNGSVAYDVNGGRSEYNNWEIDGSNVEDNGSNGTLNVYPSVDAISQVRVMTSNYGAQYGRDADGTVLVETKSGTNQWHGDAYEFVRNTSLNARNFFETTRGTYKKNDFGYTLGGPIIKNKSFIFWSEEWRKSTEPSTFQSSVPSLQERQGIFTDVCPKAGVSPGATDPNGTSGATYADDYASCPIIPQGFAGAGSYYPNDTVPIDANAKILMGMVPAPNGGSGATSVWNTDFDSPTSWREELFRFDQNLGANNHVYFNFIHDSWNTVVAPSLWGAGGLPTVSTDFVGPGIAMVAHLTSTLTPTLINDFAAGYTADAITLTNNGPIQRGSFNMGGIYNNGFEGLLPGINVSSPSDTSFTVDTGDMPWNNSNPTYTYRDQVTQILGNHSLHYGGELTASQKNEMGSQEPQGSLSFYNDWPGSTGNGLADMYIGNIGDFDQDSSRPKYYDRYKTGDLFLQDDWHARSNLTVNLGLQLDLLGNYYNANNLDSDFEPQAYDAAAFPGYAGGAGGDGSLNTATPFLSGIVQCGLGGVSQACAKGHVMNWSPRIGFSWDPTGHGTTAFRAGYGIFYDHTNGNEIMDQLRNAPAVFNADVSEIEGYSSLVAGNLGEIFPLSPGAIPTQQIWPYVQQWNANIQHQLANGLVATVSYVGSKGTHLSDDRDMNQPLLLPSSENPFAPNQPLTTADCNAFGNNGALANGTVVGSGAVPYMNTACGLTAAGSNLYRPYLGYGGIDLVEMEGNSNYNALQATLRETVGALTYNVAYSWSHSLDDASDRYDVPYVNSYDRDLAYSDSDFDIPQSLALSWVYSLPLLPHNKWVGGWEWSGIMHLQSGPPFTVPNDFSYSSNRGLGGFDLLGTMPNQVGNPNIGVQQASEDFIAGPVFYNAGAYTMARGLTSGDVGRNTLRSPGFTNFDMGLFKNFKLSERQSVQLRGEAFNVFNHTEWLPLNSGIGCFGGASNTPMAATCADGNDSLFRPSGAQPGRIVQLAIKYIF
ncbi:MAG: carboxypeptidase regulatory-like domain-containing protein [Terriglobales bacterium]